MWKEYYHVTGIYDFDYALKRLSLDPLIQVNKKERICRCTVEVG